MLFHSGLVNHDARTNIADTPLTPFLGDSSDVVTSILGLKAANSLFMCHSEQVLFWLSDSQDQKLLTHH